MPTEIRTGTGSPDPGTDPGTGETTPIGSFVYSAIDKKARTNEEWKAYWNTFTPTQKDTVRLALINSGYFEPTLTIGTTQRAWEFIVDWAATEANASNQGQKWDLKSNLGSAGAGIGQMQNAYAAFGTVLSKPEDLTGETQTYKDAKVMLNRFIYDNGIVLSTGARDKLAALITVKKDTIPYIKDGAKQLDALAKKIGFSTGGSATTLETVKQYLRNTYVLPKYAGFADEIKAGFDVRDIAQDYIQMVAQSLEIDPETIDLNDPLLSKALRPAGKNGKFDYISYGDFQTEVKKDKRWQYTNNAKEQITDLAGSIKQMFGF